MNAAPLLSVSTRAAALALVVLAQGCGNGRPEPLERSRAQAITGGAGEDDDDHAVVALSIRTPDGDEGLCSGFVVAPRVVLTAAHCVAPAAVGQGASFSLFLGSDLGDEQQTSAHESYAAVERVDYDPEVDLDVISTGHDLGVVVTTAPLPVTPLRVAPAASLEGVDEVRIVGYGVASETRADAGRRRQATAVLSGVTELFLQLGDGPAPCEGDSGGPVLVPDADGTERVAGVVSFAPTGCGSGVKVTNLSTYLPFVESQIASVKGVDADDGRDGACSVASPGRSARGWPLSLLLLFAAWRRRRSPDR